MSVIFGIFHRDSQPVSRGALANMDRALERYGSRGGFWHQAQIGLGQRFFRLSLPERDAEEPVHGRNGRLTLAFAGTLYNRDELFARLGETDRSLGDAALLLHAFDRWGDACLQEAVGSFTLALWQPDAAELLLARSAVEGPPIFYHETRQTLAFAGMRQGLFALPHVPRALDEQVLARYLTWTPVAAEQGFYQEIRQLPPGHLLRVTPDNLSLRQFWQPDLTKTIRFQRDEAYVEAFDELFGKAIESQLRGSTAVGVMMSGGFDSSSVAVVAAPLLQANGAMLHAFTEVPQPGALQVMPPGRYADETPYVQAIADMVPNLALHLVRTDGQFYLNDLDSFFDVAEVPFRNGSNRVYIEAILAEAQARGIDTLLTGDQGNLTISWDGIGTVAELLRNGRFRRAYHEARALARGGHSRSTLHTLLGRGLFPLLPRPLWRLLPLPGRARQKQIAADQHPWAPFSPVDPRFARAHRLDADSSAASPEQIVAAMADTRAARLAVLQNTANLLDGLGPGYLARYGTHMLSPAVDPRLIEFCLALPETQYQRDGTPKFLIRRAMAKRLPQVVLDNRQRGLQAADWYARLLRARPQVNAALERIAGSDLARRAIDLARLRALVAEMPEQPEDDAQVLGDYRMILEMGLMTGLFIAWFEESG